MKFSSINPSLGSSYKMTNENVRLNSSFFSYKNTYTFLNLQFFPQRFFFFYILSYQLDSLTCTKNHLFITNHLNPPPK